MGKKKRIKKNIHSANSSSKAVNQEKASVKYSVKISLFFLAVILLITAAVYSNSIDNGFVNWDDNVNVYENPHIRDISLKTLKVYFTEPLLAMYTPLVYLSYAIDYQIAGLNPQMYHFTNLLLHMLNVCLVFLLIRLFTENHWIAAIVTLIFAIHPLNVGAIAPVSVRGSLLYSMFYLAAYFCYIYYLKYNLKSKYLIGVFVLFSLSLLSKSAAVVFPLLMLLTDYFYGRKFDFRSIAEKIPFLALSIVFGILTIVFREDAGHMESQYVFTGIERIFLVSYALLFYVFKLMLPVNLSAYYPYPDNTVGLLPLEYYLSPLLIAIIIYGIYKLKKYRRELIFGAGFFLIHLLLVLKIVPMGSEITADRYAYIPSIGFFLIAVAVYKWIREINSSPNLKKVTVVLLIAVALLFSMASYNRNKVWKDNFTLYGDILDKYPNVPEAYNNRGLAKSKLKDYQGAMADYNKAIEHNPDYSAAYNSRGNLKKEQNDYKGAITDYDRALELTPHLSSVYYNRGIAKYELKDYKGAITDYDRALELTPHLSSAYYNRGLAKYELKDYKGAMADYDRALELTPDDDGAYSNRGIARYQLKDYAGAISDFDKVIELKPVAIAYINRGNAKLSQKDYAGAVTDYNKALMLSPDTAGIIANRGWIRFLSNDTSGACVDWRRAFELEKREAVLNALKQYCK